MVWFLKLCFIFMKMSTKGMFSYYRWTYLAVYVSHLFQYASIYIVIWATMRMFDMLEGFTVYQIVFLYSLDLLSYSVAQFLFQRFWWMDDLVSDGTFDDYLTRPLSPFLLFIGKNTQFGYLGHITISALVLGISIIQMDVVINIGMLLVMVLGAVMIQAALTIVPACLAFVFIKTDQLSYMLLGSFREYIMYPITIYPSFIRLALTVVVPMAFINFFPAIYLMGKDTGGVFFGYIPVIVVFVGALAAGVSVLFWRLGLRSYKSSGS